MKDAAYILEVSYRTAYKKIVGRTERSRKMRIEYSVEGERLLVRIKSLKEFLDNADFMGGRWLARKGKNSH